METIKAQVGWSGNNFSCGWSHKEIGAVIATGKTLQDVRNEFEAALQFHLEGMTEDSAPLPAWLARHDYTIQYTLSTAALIRSAEEYTTMAAISRASGINQKQLSHYANGTSTPRRAQHARIIQGLQKIGNACLSLT